MARNPPVSAARAAFAALLSGHLTGGTRPATSAGAPWTDAAFARELPSPREQGGYVSDRTVSDWRKGASLPPEIEPILRALFGPGAAPSARHAEAREALRLAFMAARLEQYAVAVDAAQTEPAGPGWIADGDHFAIDRRPQPTDQLVASDPLRRQLQTRMCTLAAKLVEPAKRLNNLQTWEDLAATVEELHAVLALDPMAIPDHLGDAYALMLALGGFLETDAVVRADPNSSAFPLDSDVRRQVSLLVQLAAPWFRGYPTIAAWDNEAGNALVKAALLGPGLEFIRRGQAVKGISARDASEMEALAKTAASGGYQGQKAGNRVIGAARNLMLTAATVLTGIVAGAIGSDFATHSVLAQRAGSMLAQGETQVAAFAKTMPADLGQALLGIVEEAQRLGSGPFIIPKSLEPPVPDDVEAQARLMILNGRAPPPEWRPFIGQLDFSWTKLASLECLSDLTALTSLTLRDTKVSDLSALSGLTALTRLDLTDTKVSDVSALAGLTALVSLNLRGTKVVDLSALSGLTALTSLNLSATQVKDLSALSGLKALRSLNLTDTLVDDLSALSGLTALTSLNLRDTKVSNLSALSGLTALTSLNVTGTWVSDVSALSGLTALTSLDLMGTRVSDVSALSGLTAMTSLDLMNTRVSDVSALAGLLALQTLDLRHTKVSDISPLAHLKTLKIRRDGAA